MTGFGRMLVKSAIRLLNTADIVLFFHIINNNEINRRIRQIIYFIDKDKIDKVRYTNNTEISKIRQNI